MTTKFDLTPALKRPLDQSQMGRDVAALNNLVGVLNDPRITGAEVPPGEDLRAHSVPVAAPNAFVDPAVLASPAQPPPPAPAVLRDIDKVFYTGRMGVGKDYVAALTGSTIFGLADPIYYLVNHFTGLKVSSISGKDIPGVRSTLQILGQWGRGDVDAEYPVSPARITFVRMVQSLGNSIDPDNSQLVDWKQFGIDKDLWLNSLVARVNAFFAENPGKRVAVTNVRFENEYKFLSAAGWKHYHVMCSPATWARRLAKQKLSPDAPQLKDKSELLANAMDADVVRRLSKQPSGSVLRVIWNDPDAKIPSSRLLTTAQFLAEVAAPVNIKSGE